MFGAFTVGQVVLVKAIGLGLALAIAMDATIVRIVAVPALMRLLGDLNWWSPVGWPVRAHNESAAERTP